MSEDRKGLAGKALTGLKWNYAGTLARAVSQMLIGIVLARILGPQPFGLVAIAWLVIGLGNLVADFGFGAALVQRQAISESEVRYVFTVQVLMGIGLTLFFVSSADLVAQVFKQQEAVPVLRVLSLIFVIQAFSQTAINLLKRNLNFKNLQLAQVLTYVVSFVLLGIPLALWGFGVWSLVIAQLSQSLLYTIITYLQVRHSIKPMFTFGASNFFGFGLKVMTINLVNWFIGNMDNVVVGRVFGVVNLGLYNRAYTLMTSPMFSFVSVLESVLFPAYSRVQDDTATLKRVYLGSVAVVALIILPVFVSAAVVPHTVIQGLYGERWLGAAPLLVPLALGIPFNALMALAGPLLWGRGKVERELLAQSVTAGLFILVLLVTSKVSVVMVAWGVFVVSIVRFVLMTTQVLRLIGASWYDVMHSVRGAVLMGLWIASLIWGVENALLTLKAPAILRLGMETLVGSAGAVGIALLLPKLVLATEMAWLVDRFPDKFPKTIRTLLVRTQRPI